MSRSSCFVSEVSESNRCRAIAVVREIPKLTHRPTSLKPCCLNPGALRSELEDRGFVQSHSGAMWSCGFGVVCSFEEGQAWNPGFWQDHCAASTIGEASACYLADLRAASTICEPRLPGPFATACVLPARATCCMSVRAAHMCAHCATETLRGRTVFGPIAVSFCLRLDASRTARLQAVLPRRRAACETPCHLRVRVACMYVYVWAKTAPAGIEPATCAVTVSCVRGCTWLQSAGSSS